MDLISIIIPVYNKEPFISSCLESVICQTYSCLQIIVIDDGSSDHSLSICRQYSIRDKRIQVYCHANSGVSYTRNVGISHATGKYIMFIDSDDTISPNYVETYYQLISKFNVDVVIGGIQKINPQSSSLMDIIRPSIEGKVCADTIWPLICSDSSGIFGFATNKIYTTAILHNNSILFNTSFSMQEDLDFALSVYHYARDVYFTQYSGYYYHYSISNRIPEFDKLISIQLRLLSLSNQHCSLSPTVIASVFHRIEDLLYVAFYSFPFTSFKSLCLKYYDITGLIDLMRLQKPTRLTSRFFYIKWFSAIKLYIFFRRNIGHQLVSHYRRITPHE